MNERARPLISLFILIILALQAVAGFRVFCPPKSFRNLSSLRILCPPLLWPFLDYPMYSSPHYAGDTISQPLVFGILEDSSEVPILPEDLGLDYWQFMRGLVEDGLLRDRRERIKIYAELYRSRHNKKLTGLRLKNHPFVLSREGAYRVSPRVVKEIRLGAAE